MPSKMKLKEYLKKLTKPTKSAQPQGQQQQQNKAADCDWQKPNWRKGNRWSQNLDQDQGTESASPQPVSSPPPIPAPPPDAQDHLNKEEVIIPWCKQSPSRTESPALSSLPKDEATSSKDGQEAEEDKTMTSLPVPQGSQKLSRSPSPCTEAWGTPTESWDRSSPVQWSDAMESENTADVTSGELVKQMDQIEEDTHRDGSDVPEAVEPENQSFNNVIQDEITESVNPGETEVPFTPTPQESDWSPYITTKENGWIDEEIASEQDNWEGNNCVDDEWGEENNGAQTTAAEDDWEEFKRQQEKLLQDVLQEHPVEDGNEIEEATHQWIECHNEDPTACRPSVPYDPNVVSDKDSSPVREWWSDPPEEVGPPLSPQPFSRKRRASSPVTFWWEEDFVAPEMEDKVTTCVPPPKLSTEDEGVPVPPPPPPPPGVPPPAPPPAPPPPLTENEKKHKEGRKVKMELIRKAVRTRPDWQSVMKDIEGGVKLRHLTTSEKLDRSRPILPKSRGKHGKFVYESEKPILHNTLLRDIQRGVKLRHVRTNDRSRPDFKSLGFKKLRRRLSLRIQEENSNKGSSADNIPSPLDSDSTLAFGVKKVRRQLTTEEKRFVDPDTPDALPSSSDEEEDIDHMRDDLQATKEQLADEIKKNKKLEREQKILQIDLDGLQAEIKKLKRQLKEAGVQEQKPLDKAAESLAPQLSKSMSKLRMKEEDLDFSELEAIEDEIKVLEGQITAQRQRAEKAEQKIEEVNLKMQLSQNECDEWEMRAIYFEKKFKSLQKEQGIELPDIDCAGIQTDPVEVHVPGTQNEDIPSAARKSASKKNLSFSRMESFKEEEEEEEESESESSEDESETEPYEEQDTEKEEECEVEELEEVNSEDKAVENEVKRKERELHLWETKLKHIIEKENNVKREREKLREKMRKYYRDCREKRIEYIKVKKELNELAKQLNPEESNELNEGYEREFESELTADGEEDWWLTEPKPKPKKLTKKWSISRSINMEDEEMEMEEEEDLESLFVFDEPVFPESDDEDSDPEDLSDPVELRIQRLMDKTRRHENKMSATKKDNYLLKAEVERCDEMYMEENRRHDRLQQELNIFLEEV